MDLNLSRSVKLNDGHVMPVLGFGTLASDDVGRTQGTGGLAMNSRGRVVSRHAPHASCTPGDLEGLIWVFIS